MDKRKIEMAIEEFNKYRDPLIVGKLLDVGEESFIMEFIGHFCRTCGFYDYFEDFQYELLDIVGLSTEIKEIEELPEGARVVYSIIDCEHTSS
jgi:superoxide reductase